MQGFARVIRRQLERGRRDGKHSFLLEILFLRNCRRNLRVSSHFIHRSSDCFRGITGVSRFFTVHYCLFLYHSVRCYFSCHRPIPEKNSFYASRLFSEKGKRCMGTFLFSNRTAVLGDAGCGLYSWLYRCDGDRRFGGRVSFNGVSVAITLILGGIAMILAERFCKKDQHEIQEGKWLSVTTKQALVIGGFQCLSVIPGMSRSASTIIGGWFAGLSTPASAEFSFFLAIPVMVGMSALKLLQLGGFGAMSGLELISLGIGFVISFAAALLVVKKFISFLQKKPMLPFAVYRVLFGGLVLLLAACHVVNFSSPI